MSPPRVKVCGLTRTEDVDAALFAGADALGFVLHEASPRSVAESRAAELCGRAGARARCYLVLVEHARADVERLMASTGAGGVQLCGDPHPGSFEDFEGDLLVRLSADERALERAEPWIPLLAGRPGRGFVLEPPGSFGGSGRAVELPCAQRLLQRLPCLLAGGLTADNVAGRIAHTGARGVDASSGLELSHGLKDPVRVTRFVRSARRALAATPDPAQTHRPSFPQAS